MKFCFLAYLLVGTVGLFAQGANIGNNHSNDLGKKGTKIMLDSIYIVGFDESNNIIDNQRYSRKYYYDSVGDNTIIMISKHNPINNKAYLIQKTTTIYELNKPKEIISYNFDTSGFIYFSSKTDLKYDFFGNLISKIIFYQNQINKEWEFNKGNYSTFITNNNITNIIDSSSDFDKIYKRMNTYDKKGNITNTIFSIFFDNSWHYTRKDENNYDENNNLLSEVISDWNSITNSWIYNKKTNNSYNTNNLNTSKITSNWNVDSNNWEVYTKYINNTDITKGTITGIDYKWDVNLVKWDVMTTDNITYNKSIDTEDIICSIEDKYYFTKYKQQLTSKIYQDYVNNADVKKVSQTFYYSPFKANTSTSELTETNINIYPNPTNGIININTNEIIESVNITDINGKLVHHQTNNSPIDISQHVRGIYFMNIISEKGVINKKIVLN